MNTQTKYTIWDGAIDSLGQVIEQLCLEWHCCCSKAEVLFTLRSVTGSTLTIRKLSENKCSWASPFILVSPICFSSTALRILRALLLSACLLIKHHCASILFWNEWNHWFFCNSYTPDSTSFTTGPNRNLDACRFFQLKNCEDWELNSQSCGVCFYTSNCLPKAV